MIVHFSHSNYYSWGKAYKLSFWRWGVTLDWGTHRFIWRVPDHREGTVIYLSQHTHAWNLTGGVIHGCRIYSCGVCGDRAYFIEGHDPSAVSPDNGKAEQ